MNIVEFINERKTKNHLNFPVDECLSYIENYADTHVESTPIKSFFHYIKNYVIDKLSTSDLTKLKVRGKKDITFYEFDEDEDYQTWLIQRLDVYSKINDTDLLRLLNFLELTTMNFITDIVSNQNYELIDIKDNIKHFIKTGYGTNQDTQSFTKYLGVNFKQGFSFKPIK